MLQKLVTEHGKEAILNEKKCRSMIADYACGEFKREIKLLLHALGEKIHIEIEKASDLNSCKLKQVRVLQEELGWAEDIAIGVVDALAMVLKGDTASSNSDSDIDQNNNNADATTNTLIQPKEKTIITFGAYEWLVLEEQKDKALILSKDIIEFRQYRDERNYTYAECSLRAYLNGEFYSKFSASDKNRIIQVNNTNENNQWYGTSGGANSLDFIFLLSISEVVKYFGDSGQLSKSGTWHISDCYNSERIAKYENDFAYGWWLRSPGKSSYTSCVLEAGRIYMHGFPYIAEGIGIRPALWINLESFDIQTAKIMPKENSKDVSATANIIVKPKEKRIITFGDYEWLVLEVLRDRTLILSKDIIEQKMYHENDVPTTWAECSIRAYLNTQFYYSFNVSDKSRIMQVNNNNENNLWYGTNGGSNTSDNIFLLSIEEVVKYFGDSGQLKNRPIFKHLIDDIYNSERIAKNNGSAFDWWLRSPGIKTNYASCVSQGFIIMLGTQVNDDRCGIRPALWLWGNNLV